MAAALADAIGGFGVAAGAKGALEQPFDRGRVAGRLRQDGQRQFAHAPVRLAFGPIPVHCRWRFAPGLPKCERQKRRYPAWDSWSTAFGSKTACAPRMATSSGRRRVSAIG